MSFCAALALAAVVLMVAGTGTGGIQTALLWTARLAFLLFWPAYAGGALVLLFGQAFRPVQRRARELGLAFAAALSMHLGLVAWLCLIGAAPPVKTFIVFGVAVLCVYLLALFSVARLQPLLGTAGWWFLRTAGMNYIAFAFALDFLRHPLAGGILHAVFYWPFAALAIAGPAFRLAAGVRRAAGGPTIRADVSGRLSGGAGQGGAPGAA